MSDDTENIGSGDPVCGAIGRTGKPCGKPAGWGTPHLGRDRCRLHGGSTPTHITKAERVAAGFIADTYGLPRPGKADPRDVLLEELMRTLGHVDWLSEVVRRMDPDALVMGVTRIVEGEKPYGDLGLAGRVWEITESAAPSVWIDLYRREREHLYKLAKDMAALGLLERQVQIEEAQAGLLASALLRITGRLTLSAEQRLSLPQIVREELLALDTEASTAEHAAAASM